MSTTCGRCCRTSSRRRGGPTASASSSWRFTARTVTCCTTSCRRSPTSARTRTAAASQNRMRFPLEVFEAVRDAWPAHKPIGVRISAVDWVEGGWTLEDSIEYAKALQDARLRLHHGVQRRRRRRPEDQRRPGIPGAVRRGHSPRDGHLHGGGRAHHRGEAGRSDPGRRQGRSRGTRADGCCTTRAGRGTRPSSSARSSSIRNSTSARTLRCRAATFFVRRAWRDRRCRRLQPRFMSTGLSARRATTVAQKLS